MQHEGTARDRDGRTDRGFGQAGGDDEQSEQRLRPGRRTDADAVERPIAPRERRGIRRLLERAAELIGRGTAAPRGARPKRAPGDEVVADRGRGPRGRSIRSELDPRGRRRHDRQAERSTMGNAVARAMADRASRARTRDVGAQRRGAVASEPQRVGSGAPSSSAAVAWLNASPGRSSGSYAGTASTIESRSRPSELTAVNGCCTSVPAAAPGSCRTPRARSFGWRPRGASGRIGAQPCAYRGRSATGVRRILHSRRLGERHPLVRFSQACGSRPRVGDVGGSARPRRQDRPLADEATSRMSRGMRRGS